MKFTVSSSALLSLLATTGKVISNKNTLPILDYFLMELKDGELTVTTSDLETTLIGHLKVESVEREGVIAAPAKLMLDSLKEFPEMPLEFDVNDTTWEIKVKWASGSLSIPGASAVSYPAMQTIGAEHKEILLDVDMLIAGINKTIFATADDELRPVMNGVYFNFEEGKITGNLCLQCGNLSLQLGTQSICARHIAHRTHRHKDRIEGNYHRQRNPEIAYYTLLCTILHRLKKGLILVENIDILQATTKLVVVQTVAHDKLVADGHSNIVYIILIEKFLGLEEECAD